MEGGHIVHLHPIINHLEKLTKLLTFFFEKLHTLYDLRRIRMNIDLIIPEEEGI